MTLNTPCQTASRLIGQLKNAGLKIAFAESCTCGMAAAMVGGVPGASEVFCGSMVTYRVDSKQKWLGVDPETIQQYTAESRQTTQAMAVGVLLATPEADMAAAITGDLGPNVTGDKGGRVFVAFLRRPVAGHRNDSHGGDLDHPANNHEFHLRATSRIERQIEAAERWIDWIDQQWVRQFD